MDASLRWHDGEGLLPSDMGRLRSRILVVTPDLIRGLAAFSSGQTLKTEDSGIPDQVRDDGVAERPQMGRTQPSPKTIFLQPRPNEIVRTLCELCGL